MKKNLKAAMDLVRLARTLIVANTGFDNPEFNGPEGAIVVTKKTDPDNGPAFVYAHQITQDDLKDLEGAESKEKKYDAEDIKVGNWIATKTNLTAEAGKFWIIDQNTFSGKNKEKTLYEEEAVPGDTIKAKYCKGEFTFEKHLANQDLEFVCFRLPTVFEEKDEEGKDIPIPENTVYNIDGNNFTPGAYVFLNLEGTNYDIYERAKKYMDGPNYEFKEKYTGEIPPEAVALYNKVIQENKELFKEYLEEQQNQNAK